MTVTRPSASSADIAVAAGINPAKIAATTSRGRLNEPMLRRLNALSRDASFMLPDDRLGAVALTRRHWPAGAQAGGLGEIRVANDKGVTNEPSGTRP
jgi:hypothetical protein